MTVDDLRQARAELVMINPQPYNAEAPPRGLVDDITPTSEHYVRSNFALPAHDGTLVVGGAVERPLTLTLAELRDLPAVESAVTLECAGNGRLDTRPLPTGEPWGRGAVSTARWTGARLSDILDLAGPRIDGIEVRCEGADSGTYHLTPILPETGDQLRFVRSLSLAHAADPASDIMVAYAMNGAPLEPDHGRPFRLIVPDWFAVASVKWLTRLDVLTEPFVGEFQTGHYMYEWPDRQHEPVTHLRVRARITDPAPEAVIPLGPCTVRGKAWSGTGPVTAVQVCFAGDGVWHEAELGPRREPHTWQSWSYTWEPGGPGRYSLRARATDAAGNVQPDVPPWNRLGYGNNAVEVQYVDVA
ncbi:sulfite oxidase [Occultella glacieicola]|uniref:Sulfite oxidase n=1 Tax=Occultella glacieicola TaxID=2518684 RepID=A0ABY2E1V2_9MICO|nr:sulfite oxidase [Occultella glacieicola]TDE92589.1 sulfite oxidase [Occultella glacieicola]